MRKTCLRLFRRWSAISRTIPIRGKCRLTRSEDRALLRSNPSAERRTVRSAGADMLDESLCRLWPRRMVVYVRGFANIGSAFRLGLCR